MGPKDEVHEDPTQNKPLDDQLLLVEDSSLNSENAGLSFENPHNLTHNTLSGRSGISAIEGEHEPSDENVQEPKTIGCSKMAVLGASEALSQKNADVSLIISKPKPEDSGSIPSNKECELLFPEGDEKTSPRASLQTGNLEIRTLTTSSNIPSRFGQHCVTSSRISDEMETGCKKSNLMGSCDADIGRGSKHEITPVKSGGDHESAQPAEVDKTSCGSPAIISSSEPSGIETNDLEDAKGYEITEHAIKGYEITEHAKGYVNASASNNSISTSPTPRQPFTESQLIQLRALILVCGAVFRGNAPDFDDMASLFGLNGTWYSTWGKAVERTAAISIGAKIDEKRKRERTSIKVI